MGSERGDLEFSLSSVNRCDVLIQASSQLSQPMQVGRLVAVAFDWKGKAASQFREHLLFVRLVTVGLKAKVAQLLLIKPPLHHL